MPKIYSLYDRPSPVVEINNEPTLAQQHFRDECDINHILARYQKTGILCESSSGVLPSFGDFGTSLDYQESQNAILAAQSDFMSLPSSIRKRFENNPYKLLEFLEKEENRDEAISLGLVNASDNADVIDRADGTV